MNPVRRFAHFMPPCDMVETIPLNPINLVTLATTVLSVTLTNPVLQVGEVTFFAVHPRINFLSESYHSEKNIRAIIFITLFLI